MLSYKETNIRIWTYLDRIAFMSAKLIKKGALKDTAAAISPKSKHAIRNVVQVCTCKILMYKLFLMHRKLGYVIHCSS